MPITTNSDFAQITIEEPGTFISIGGDFSVSLEPQGTTINLENQDTVIVEIAAQQGPAGPLGLAVIPKVTAAAGAINEINVIFTLPVMPMEVSGYYLNGLFNPLLPSQTVGKVVTLDEAPYAGDSLLIVYTVSA